MSKKAAPIPLKANNQDLLMIISSLQNTFTKSEQKLVDLILKSPEKIVYMSIADLADEIDIGEATIIRFCRKIGCDGYYAFKMCLAKSLPSETQSDILTPSSKAEQPTDLLTGISAEIQQGILETMAVLDYPALKEVVTWLLAARRIRVYAVGASATAAIDAKNRFLRIGLDIDYFIDGHGMAIDASLSQPEDVILGISYSGETIDLVEAFRIARQSGAKLVAITHFQKSYLGKYADKVLLTGSREGPLHGGALQTKITQLFVIEALFREVFASDPEVYSQRHNLTSKGISGKIR